jgi:phosphoglycolate phosphatase
MAIIRNIILDWSGTIVDDLGPVVAATNEIFKQYGKPAFTVAEFREKFFLPFPDFYRQYLPEATMVELDHHYHTAFKLLQDGIPLLPHALEFLQYCQQRGMPLFLLSTIHAEHFRVQGEKLGVAHFFQQAYTQAIDKRKTILHLLAEHDLEPAETIFVGDMMHDIETARHGGVISCAVLTGYDSLQKLKSVEPDLLFRDIGQVQNFLDRHQGEIGKLPIGTVGALIRHRNGKVLMLRTYKWSNKWGIPGGKIKWNESSEAALIREIAEETGLAIQKIEFQMVQDCIASTEFYKPSHFLLLNYTCECTEEKVQLNDEADDYRWVSMAEALTMDLNEPTRRLVEYVRAKNV